MEANKKTYTIEVEEKDGMTTMTRINDGFNALELLGILELTQQDIVNQIKDSEESDIDVVKREIVED
jgi:hypothetical protein